MQPNLPSPEAATPAPDWVLVVDDNPIDRRVAGSHVEKGTGLKVQYATNGREALQALKQAPPAAILTDIQMPLMDGLELVDAVTDNYPLVPVILMTSMGSEEAAIEALRRGAAGYVPKRDIATLKEILPQILARSRIDRRRQELNKFIDHLECRFVLENDPLLVQVLVAQFQEQLVGVGVCGTRDKTRVGVALEEAMLNGLFHGNLEVSSDLKQQPGDAFRQLADERRAASPYRERRLHVHALLTPSEATFMIRDEGPGFDTTKLPDPTDPENLLKPSGRGVLLIRTFMDEVAFSPRGNQITMYKRRKPAAPAA